MIKKILSTILIIVAFFTVSGCANSQTVSGRVRELNVSESDVALLTIFSDNGKGESNWLTRNYGHSFFTVTNLSNQELIVGDMVVNPSDTIAVGLWSIYEHFGVWYNVESNYIKEHNKYAQRVSLTIGVSLEDIYSITEVIKNNDLWTPLYNCSKFALDVWNTVASENEKIDTKLLMSPGYLVEEIKKFAGYEDVRPCNTSNIVRYYGEV